MCIAYILDLCSLLSTKMFTDLNFLSSKSRKDWRLFFDERLWYKMQCEVARIEPHKHDSLSQVEIKTNPLKSTQHALTIRHTIDERPEEEEAEAGAPNATPISKSMVTPVPSAKSGKVQRIRCFGDC
eukprot:406167_1